MALLNEPEEANELCTSMHDTDVKALHFLELYKILHETPCGRPKYCVCHRDSTCCNKKGGKAEFGEKSIFLRSFLLKSQNNGKLLSAPDTVKTS